MFSLRQINDEVVRPVKPLKDPDTRPVRGSSLFSECNASVFICASRGSGKTSVIGKILRKCIGRDSKVIVFCANLDKDKSWIALDSWLDKNFEYHGFTSITDPETGINYLDELNKDILERAKESRQAAEESEDEIPEPTAADLLREVMFDSTSDSEPEQKKPAKEKYRAPEYIIVFDDLSDEIRNSTQVARLLKNGRHFCKVIISSQYLKDLKPEARTNIDYFILFRGLDEDTLRTVFRNAKLSIDFDQFKALYDEATKKKYDFLYIDTRENKFRRNFTHEFQFSDRS